MSKKEEKYLRVMQETAYAEFGSALEMLSACKQSKQEKFCFGFFHHSKDEYNHTQVFLSLLSKYGKNINPELAREYRFAAQSLINKGYISPKGFLVETMKFKDFIAYVYTNELLAKESFEKILKLVNPFTLEGNQISQIMKDELRHHGLAKKHFLKYYPRLQPWQLMVYRVRETLQNKGRKIYDSNLRLLDKILSPLYKSISYVAGLVIKNLNLNEFDRKGKNLMNLSSSSII